MWRAARHFFILRHSIIMARDRTKIKPRESISLTDTKKRRHCKNRDNSYPQKISNANPRMYNVRVPSDILEPYITCVRRCGFTQGEVIATMMQQWVHHMKSDIIDLGMVKDVDALRTHSKAAIIKSIDDTIAHLRRLSMDDHDELSLTGDYVAQPNNNPNARWRRE